jgi:phage baseplate assembly protein W
MATLAKIYSDLAFSPLLNNEGDISQVYDTVAINQSLFNILNTRKGSRVMDPLFGCNFQSYLFEIFDTETLKNITDDIQRNFSIYEPRIIIESIDKNLNYDTLEYTLYINYRFSRKNERGKFEVVLQKL